MNQSETRFDEIIQCVRDGDRQSLGELLERFRPYLRLLVQRELDGLDARLDASDVVQRTCLSAIRNVADFKGNDEAQFIAWLQLIHRRNIQDTIRNNVYAQKRAAGREDKSAAARLQEHPAASNRQASASQRAMQGENAVRLAQCLETLPEDQREAVRLRYLEGCSIFDISRLMDRSESAVGGLLKRGLNSMRSHLKE